MEYLPDQGYVAAHWQGFINANELMHGLLLEMDYCTQLNCPLLLHNRYDTYATPTILQSWLKLEYMPRVAESPIRYVAYILPQNHVAEQSSSRALEAIQNFGVTFGIYKEVEPGIQWLLSLRASA
jgi:hypothetical protein